MTTQPERSRTARLLDAVTHNGPGYNTTPNTPSGSTEDRIRHLLDRMQRGVLLPAEGEQLAGLVGELEKSAEINAEVDAQADEQLNGAREVAQYYKAVAEQAQAWGEQHRDRANRYRARTEAVRAELNAMRHDMGSNEDDGMSTAVSRIQAALHSVSHETPVPDDPRVTELEKQLENQAATDQVANRASQVITAMGADIRVARAERDRYRTAWKSAASRASAYSEGIMRLCDDRDAYEGWMEQEQAHSAGLRAEVARLTAGQDHTCPDGQPCPGHDEPATA